MFQLYRFNFSGSVEISSTLIETLLEQGKKQGLLRLLVDQQTLPHTLTIILKNKKKEAGDHEQWVDFLEKYGIYNLTLNSTEQWHKPKNASHHHDHGHSHDHHSHSNTSHWLKAGLGFTWGLTMMILAVTGLQLPALLLYGIITLNSVMTLYLGSAVYKSAWQALKNKQLNTGVLYTLSTLAMLFVSLASFFIPGLPLMIEVAPLVLGFWHLGEGIEHSLIDQITHKLELHECLPHKVQLKNSRKKVSIHQLIPGDQIQIKPGAIIPVDGQMLTSAYLLTTRIDGSPTPKLFQPGDEVKAGMEVTEGQYIEMQVNEKYIDSYIARLTHQVKQLEKQKMPLEQFANTILHFFVPGLLAIATISALAIGWFFTPALAIQCFIAVLVSACPCALSVITPLAVKIGFSKAAKLGITIQDGEALQAAADIDTIVFDINGTLTEGKIHITQCNLAEQRYLNYIAVLESHSKHPVARIIQTFCTQDAGQKSANLSVTQVQQTHNGIKGDVAGEEICIGNEHFFQEQGLNINHSPYYNTQAGTIYISCNQEIIGYMTLADTLRKDTLMTISQLQKTGKKIYLCTGADLKTAEYYAQQLGIPRENLFANAGGLESKPGQQTKKDYIDQLKMSGNKIAMIGDALNDQEALVSAHLGIAMRSTIGKKDNEAHAGMVIADGLLSPLIDIFELAKRTKRNIIQNLAISLTYNSAITLIAGGIFVVLGFALNPIVGIGLMILESTLVLANLYRFKQQRNPRVSDALSLNQSQPDSYQTMLKPMVQPRPHEQIVPSSAAQHFASPFDNLLSPRAEVLDQGLENQFVFTT